MTRAARSRARPIRTGRCGCPQTTSNWPAACSTKSSSRARLTSIRSPAPSPRPTTCCSPR